MILGRAKQLAAQLQDARKQQRARKFESKKKLLNKELIAAQKRKELADKEIEIRKIDANIRKERAANPTRREELLSKFGRGALKAGRAIAKNTKNKRSTSKSTDVFTNQSWIGNSPLTKTK